MPSNAPSGWEQVSKSVRLGSLRELKDNLGRMTIENQDHLRLTLSRGCCVAHKCLGPCLKTEKPIPKSPVLLTVCIPIHDPLAKYKQFVIELLSSVREQTMRPDEVLLVSNHQIDYLDEIMNLFSPDLNIKWFKSEAKSAPENINFGIKSSAGSVVKLMFQDDFLIEKGTLSRLYAATVEGDSGWAAAAFDHLDSASLKVVRPMIPKFSPKLVRGVNKMGAPSVIAFRRQNFIEMDANLKFMFDCDWYLAMHNKWGLPTIDRVVGVRIRLHEGQATTWAHAYLKRERIYCAQKQKQRKSSSSGGHVNRSARLNDRERLM